MKIANITLLFFLCLMPKIGSLDLVIILSLLNVFLILIFHKNIYLEKNYFFLCLLLMFLLLLSFASYLINDDLFGFLRVIKNLLLVLLIPILLKEMSSHIFFHYFTLFLLLAVLILYLEYFNIFGFKEYINLLHDYMYGGRTVSYRAKGIFAGYSAAGVTCGLISLYALYFTLKNLISPKIGYLLYILSIIATLFTGRTGAIISIFGSILYIFLYYKKLIKFKYFMYTFILVLASIIIVPSFLSSSDIDNISITFIRTFELFINYANNNELSSESTTQLAKTLALPENLSDIILGNGLEPWSIHSISKGAHQSDSGIIQNLFIYGLFGFIVYYLPIIYICVASVIKKHPQKTYILIMFILGAISEIKGHYLYSGLIFTLITFPFFLNIKIEKTVTASHKNYPW